MNLLIISPKEKGMEKLDEFVVAGLIEGFYEAATRPELWRQILARSADAFGARGSCISTGPESNLQPVCSPSLDEVVDIGLKQGWHGDNVRMVRGAPHFNKSGNIVTERMLFTPWELDNLPFHAEYLNRLDLHHFAGMVIFGNASTGLAFSVERSRRQGAFVEKEIDVLRRLVPHIQGAGRLAREFAHARHEGALDAFAAFDCGALLIDWRGRVARVNRKAEAMMGPWLSIRNGILTAADSNCDAALRKMIDVLVSHGPLVACEPLNLVAVPRPPAKPLVVHAAPLARSATDLFMQARAVIWIVDPYANTLPWEPVLRQAFGCTKAESEVAVALAQGHDVEEIARIRGVSHGTIRAQIKGIFTKTDTRRQAELVSLLLRFAPFPK
jgi:DNA-binding CsgD family transcriptional regulator